MRVKYYILIIACSTFLRGDYFSLNDSGISSAVTLDVISPTLNLEYPIGGEEFEQGQSIEIQISYADDNLTHTPVAAYLLTDVSTYELNEFLSLDNLSIILPEINTSQSRLKIVMTDYFGNYSEDISNPFTIGEGDQHIDIVQYLLNDQGISSVVTLDVIPPNVNLTYPTEDLEFEGGDELYISWVTQEDHFPETPYLIEFSEFSGSEFYVVAANIPVSESTSITLPSINSQTASLRITVIDYFGNENEDYSPVFSIGAEEHEVVEQFVLYDQGISSSLIMDIVKPDIVIEYPNGGELVDDFENCNISCPTLDDNLSSNGLTIEVSYALGGHFVEVASGVNPNYISEYTVDLSSGGEVPESIYGLMRATVKDDFGNESTQMSGNYFILGEPEGDIGVNWVDIEQRKVVIDWGWIDNHNILITNEAIESIANYDNLTIYDEQGINTEDCDSESNNVETGFVELKTIPIENLTEGRAITLDCGFDYCDLGGSRIVGYNPGSQIKFMVSHSGSDEFHVLQPTDQNNSIEPLTYSNSMDIIVDFDLTGESLRIPNFTPTLSNDGQRFDSFNVYYRVTATNLRDCDPPPSAGLNDSNGDGQSDANWCYDGTIQGQTNYVSNLPQMQQSSNIKYRTWLLNNDNDEILKTLDTDGIYYEVDLADIYENSLSAGWNWLSLNKTSDDMSMNNILSSLSPSLSDDYGYIKGQGGFADYYSGFGWYGTLSEMDNLSAYKLDINYPGDIVYEGTSVDVNTTPISISSGWNWISYLPQESMDINTAFASLSTSSSDGDYIKSQGGFADYYAGFGWYGTLSTMSPTEGYMLDANNSGTLLYPASGSLSIASSSYHLSRQFDEFNNTDYEYNGSVTIALELSDVIPQEGDKIRAYHNEQLRGVSNGTICPINHKLVFPMMFYGYEEGEELSFEYYNGSNEPIKLLGTIQFIPDMHLNDALNPYIMSDEHPLIYSLSDAYPNPFNPTTTINYSIADNINDLSINVYDVRGRLVDRLYEGARDKGEYQFVWNASALSSGVYFIHMIAGEHVFTNKVMLVK